MLVTRILIQKVWPVWRIDSPQEVLESAAAIETSSSDSSTENNKESDHKQENHKLVSQRGKTCLLLVFLLAIKGLMCSAVTGYTV